MKTQLQWILAACAMAAGAAQAQPAGALMARIGVANVNPQVSSGNLSPPSVPGTQIDMGSATQLFGGATYMLTSNWAIDLPVAMPLKHEISGAGTVAGVGRLGEVRSMPVSVLAQYRFGDAKAQMRPYVGVGATYVKFSKESGSGRLSAITGGAPTTFSVESKLAATVQAGAVFALNDRWFVDAMVALTPLKTRATLSTGQNIDLKLDPATVSLSVGYRY